MWKGSGLCASSMCLRCESWQKRPVSRRTPFGGLRMPTAKRIRPRSASSPGLSACSRRNSSRRAAAMGKTKSRANGDGDVFPRKNKAGKITSYRGAYVGPDGKRHYVSGKTKTEAREALAAARAEAVGGVVLDAGKLTVAEYLERWLSDCLTPLVKSGKMEHSTYVRYAGIVNNHISPTIGAKRLRDLSRSEVRTLYSAKGNELSPRSVDYIHVTLQ